MASAKKIMLHQDELFGIAAAGAGICLAPGLTLFRRHLDDAAQQELVNEIAEAVLQAPSFVPRMPRSGRAFSVKMTNCGSLDWVSDRNGGYRYLTAHPVTGLAWPSIPLLALNTWRALASYPHPPEACLVNFYGCDAKMGLHQDRDEAELAAAWAMPAAEVDTEAVLAVLQPLWHKTPESASRLRGRIEAGLRLTTGEFIASSC